jgi:hypothetical protein
MDTFSCQHCGDTFPADKRTSCRCCSPANVPDALDAATCAPSSDTPETDEIWNGEWNHAYLFSRMRKMERERDEARKLAEHYRRCHCEEEGIWLYLPWEDTHYKAGKSTIFQENADDHAPATTNPTETNQ